MTSLRELTSRIRRLDPAAARELVGLFARPIAAGDASPRHDHGDPVAGTSHGLLTLHPTAGGNPGATVGHYATHLYLHELERLPLSVARELTRHRGHLYLDRLLSITDGVAEELARHRGGGLSLNNLRLLSAAQAAALGRHEHELSLDRIGSLSIQQARGLARHANKLYLERLSRLDPAAAAALARHRGDLILGGFRRLPAAIAWHLASHGGQLHLHRLRTISTPVAEAFAGRRGHLCLNDLRRVTPRQVALLARHVGVLCLDRLVLDEHAAACLGEHVGSLIVSLPDAGGTALLESLLAHRGPLHVDGIRSLDIRRARAIAAQHRPGGIAGLDGIFLPAIVEVTPAIAAILAGHRGGGLSLRGIATVSTDVVRQLVRHPLLALDGVRHLDDRSATILAAHEGGVVSLLGLEQVSPRGLAALRRNPGVVLPPRLARSAEPAGGERAASITSAIERLVARVAAGRG